VVLIGWDGHTVAARISDDGSKDREHPLGLSVEFIPNKRLGATPGRGPAAIRSKKRGVVMGWAADGLRA